MPKYYVDVLIGTSYELLIEAPNKTVAMDIAEQWDPDGSTPDIEIESVDEGEVTREILYVAPVS